MNMLMGYKFAFASIVNDDLTKVKVANRKLASHIYLQEKIFNEFMITETCLDIRSETLDNFMPRRLDNEGNILYEIDGAVPAFVGK